MTGPGTRQRSVAGRPASSAGSTGSAAMTSRHFGHSELWTTTATGPPSVTPCRTPPRISTSSRSNCIRAPRPYPARRRTSSAAMSAVVIAHPGGQAFDGGHERGAVRLTRCQPPQHEVQSPMPGRPAFGASPGTERPLAITGERGACGRGPTPAPDVRRCASGGTRPNLAGQRHIRTTVRTPARWGPSDHGGSAASPLNPSR